MEHFSRWLVIRWRLPDGAAENVFKKHPEWSKKQIIDVAKGQTFDFEILAALELVRQNRLKLIKRENLAITQAGIDAGTSN